MKRECIGKPISSVLENLIGERESVLNNREDRGYVAILDQQEEKRAQVISPILCEGDAIGAVVMMGKNESVQMGEKEQIVAKCAANFMGKQMES